MLVDDLTTTPVISDGYYVRPLSRFEAQLELDGKLKPPAVKKAEAAQKARADWKGLIR